jgi:hypothetical protein
MNNLIKLDITARKKYTSKNAVLVASVKSWVLISATKNKRKTISKTRVKMFHNFFAGLSMLEELGWNWSIDEETGELWSETAPEKYVIFRIANGHWRIFSGGEFWPVYGGFYTSCEGLRNVVARLSSRWDLFHKFENSHEAEEAFAKAQLSKETS